MLNIQHLKMVSNKWTRRWVRLLSTVGHRGEVLEADGLLLILALCAVLTAIRCIVFGAHGYLCQHVLFWTCEMHSLCIRLPLPSHIILVSGLGFSV